MGQGALPHTDTVHTDIKTEMVFNARGNYVTPFDPKTMTMNPNGSYSDKGGRLLGGGSYSPHGGDYGNGGGWSVSAQACTAAGAGDYLPANWETTGNWVMYPDWVQEN